MRVNENTSNPVLNVEESFTEQKGARNQTTMNQVYTHNPDL